jgi:hypothetical protein
LDQIKPKKTKGNTEKAKKTVKQEKKEKKYEIFGGYRMCTLRTWISEKTHVRE